MGYLNDRNIPADEITLKKLAQQILDTPPEQGYLTITNALQWSICNIKELLILGKFD